MTSPNTPEPSPSDPVPPLSITLEGLGVPASSLSDPIPPPGGIAWGAYSEAENEHGGRQASYSFTGLIAPVLTGFSLPAIIVFASNTYPGEPSHGIILSLLVAATGLFMASIQLTTPLVDDRYIYAGSLRSGLTMLGICLVAVAIILLGEPAMHQWYGVLALIVIFIGSVVPTVLLVILWFRADRPAGGATR